MQPRNAHRSLFHTFTGSLVGLVLVSACGSSTAEPGDDGSSTIATITVPGDETSTTISDETTTTPTTAPTSTTLAGEPIDFGPKVGDSLAVVGVAHDDTLNVRSGPGTDQGIVTELQPLATGIAAQGNTRTLSQSIWVEVYADGAVGWASLAFLGYLGVVTDETAALIELLGETPAASDMEALGLLVAEAYASDDPPSRIRMVVAPTVGDLGEVTYDVVGIGDDALMGYRLHVFGASEDGGSTYELKSLEVTAICSRGVTDDDLCT